MGLKSIYVGAVRTAGKLADSVGILPRLERGGRTSRWARSLFAIYDIDQMVRLDLPWWTFDAIGQVDAFLKANPGARVFEYGSGASTIWLAKRAGSVVSVEHDADWFPIVRSKLAAFKNATLKLVPPDATRHPSERYASAKKGWKNRSFLNYVHSIDEVEGQFDLIVVDGRARVACLEEAQRRLAPGGLIVFDNTHRKAYRRAIAASPMRATVTRGLTACLPYPDETTLLTV